MSASQASSLEKPSRVWQHLWWDHFFCNHYSHYLGILYFILESIVPLFFYFLSLFTCLFFFSLSLVISVGVHNLLPPIVCLCLPYSVLCLREVCQAQVSESPKAQRGGHSAQREPSRGYPPASLPPFPNSESTPIPFPVRLSPFLIFPHWQVV